LSDSNVVTGPFGADLKRRLGTIGQQLLRVRRSVTPIVDLDFSVVRYRKVPISSTVTVPLDEWWVLLGYDATTYASAGIVVNVQDGGNAVSSAGFAAFSTTISQQSEPTGAKTTVTLLDGVLTQGSFGLWAFPVKLLALPGNTVNVSAGPVYFQVAVCPSLSVALRLMC